MDQPAVMKNEVPDQMDANEAFAQEGDRLQEALGADQLPTVASQPPSNLGILALSTFAVLGIVSLAIFLYGASSSTTLPKTGTASSGSDDVSPKSHGQTGQFRSGSSESSVFPRTQSPPANKSRDVQLAGNWTEPRDSHGLMHLWHFSPNGSFISQSQGGRGSLVSNGSWKISGKSVLLEGKKVIFTGSTVRHGGFTDELEIVDATSLRRLNGSIILKNR